MNKQGKVVWQFDGQANDTKLNKPSLAIELPNGNILANDDLNHRVIVIDKTTKKIVWQYGVTGKPGSGPGQLNIPDGVDIIPVSSNDHPIMSLDGVAPLSIGQVTRHPAQYVGKELRLVGYVLRIEKNDAIFSDEAAGAITAHDLPVNGPGFADLQVGHKYLIDGTFLDHGLVAGNNNPDHLILTTPPQSTP